MKRLIAVLLSLCLLAGLAPAALAEADAPALPALGDVVHGFRVIETRDYPLMDAVIVRFEHEKTGAELFYIANDDVNRAFDLTFFTDTVDNTGLPHVFEHATTAGSRKYPSPAAWFNLEFQTYNSYWNAHTFQRMTSYPCASLSEAQLLKYADYFTDSCFNPTLMDGDDVLRTEGWRYRLDEPDGELSYEGTVYSEMLGAWTLELVAGLNSMRAMFPGSIAGNELGGDPAFIPDLTWDMLKDYHERYYHPSNCVAYLYGSFEDYEAFPALLDSYFSAYDRQEIVRDDSGYTPITGTVTQALPFPVEQGFDTEHASTVDYGIVCPGLEQENLLGTLGILLSVSSSKLQQALQEALPYGSFGVSLNMEGPEDAMEFTAINVDPGDAELFRQIVDDALRDVAENGLPQDQVDGAMASLSTSALLLREQSNPVGSLILNMAYYYSITGDPWRYQEYQDALFMMDEWNQNGLYAEAVRDWLLDSDTAVLVTTYPEPGGKEAADAALREKLAGIKAGMSEEEIAGIVAASNAPVEQDDASAIVAQLQAVTVDALPEELKLYELTDETDADGVRRISAEAGVDGIGEVGILLDASGIEQEELHWFSLYTDLLFRLDTSEHTKAELAKLAERYLYNGTISLSLLREVEGGYRPCLSLSWIARDEDLETGYSLMREILFDTKADDPEKLLEQVQFLRTGLKSSITANPAAAMMRRALGVSDEMYRYKTYIADLDYYDFLLRTEQQLAEDPALVRAKLEGVRASLDNRTNAVLIFAGNEESIALNREISDGFLSSLDARPIERAQYELPVPADREALVIDSGVQYNLLMADYQTLGLEGYNGQLQAVANVVSDLFLFPLLRDQYGVYTPQHNALTDGGEYIYAYRDPNIGETFALLEELPELVAELEIDQETLNGYILRAYSAYAMPTGELAGAVDAIHKVLEGRPQDEALTWMRELKRLTPASLKTCSALYEKLAEGGKRRTAGGMAAIQAEADAFDVILNPFGAVDKTRTALSDLPEGSAHYDAVRYAYESGLMAPLDGALFGVDEVASNADMLTSVFVLLGGPADAELALESLAAYGLIPADTALSAPAAPGDLWALLSAISAETVEPLVETTDPDTLTRAELAETLLAFTNTAENAA